MTVPEDVGQLIERVAPAPICDDCIADTLIFLCATLTMNEGNLQLSRASSALSTSAAFATARIRSSDTADV